MSGSSDEGGRSTSNDEQPETPRTKPTETAEPKQKASAKASSKASSKAKASPKGSAKAKVKASAKVSAKGSAKAKVSAPKAEEKAEETPGNIEDDKPKPIKKPKLTLKDLNQSLLAAAKEKMAADADSDSDPEDMSEEDDAEGRRDRCKSQKFSTLLSQNKLPKHIVDMWFQGAKDQKQPRQYRTKIINTLFDRDERGKLVMKPEAPFFSAYKETTEKKSFGVTQTGLPKSVFKGMYFQNSELALQDAIAQEDVEVVVQGGKEWYSFITLEKKHQVSKSSGQKVVGQEKKIDADTCKGMDKAFDKLDWDFQSIGSGGSSSCKPEVQHNLAIQDVPLDEGYFQQVQSLLLDAKNALEKLSKDLLKVAPLVSQDPKHSAMVFSGCTLMCLHTCCYMVFSVVAH